MTHQVRAPSVGIGSQLRVEYHRFGFVLVDDRDVKLLALSAQASDCAGGGMRSANATEATRWHCVAKHSAREGHEQ